MQNNLRIIDPLYGILRPLDRMQPYRLEMATRNVFGKDDTTKLNDLWKESVTQQLARELALRPRSDQQILLNLASDEYAAAVDATMLQEAAPNSKYVKVVFRDQGRVVAVHAKRARGLMVRFVAETQAKTLEDVQDFDAEGYKLVFDRPKQIASKMPSAKKAPAAKGQKRAASATKKEATTEEAKKRGRKTTS